MEGGIKKKGFSSVYIVIMLGSLLFLVFCVLEAATGYAAASISEEVTALAGRSVLSYYDTALYERYGVFALEADDEKLAAYAKHYIDASIKGEGLLVTRMRSGRVTASSVGLEGTQLAPFKEQVVQLGTLCAAGAALDQGSIFSGAVAASSAADTSFAGQLQSIATEPPDPEYLEESQKEEGEEGTREKKEDPKEPGRRQARKLLSDYDRAVRAGGSPMLLLSSGSRDWSAEALAVDEYILDRCGRITKSASGGTLQLETEFIMYGYRNDSANQACVRSSLFWTRMPLNTAKILKDPVRRREIEAAAAAFTAIPYPLAFAALLAINAAIDSNGDVTKIISGEVVPVIESLPSFGSYDDYLRLLLLAVPEDKKLARLMDVMQQNVKGLDMHDMCFGFELEAAFEKRCYAPGFQTRKRTVTQRHVYK